MTDVKSSTQLIVSICRQVWKKRWFLRVESKMETKGYKYRQWQFREDMKLTTMNIWVLELELCLRVFFMCSHLLVYSTFIRYKKCACKRFLHLQNLNKKEKSLMVI